MLICAEDICTGCSCCVNVCPQECISLKENTIGELHPQIDEAKCIHCNNCVLHCPANMITKGAKPIAVYAAWRKFEDKIQKSASGGIGAVLAETALENNFDVYGVLFNDELIPLIECQSSINGIEKFKGSKYVQANAGNCYKEISSKLRCGKKILFFGTPCQVAALQSVVGTNRDNLITVEILCHGVSPFRYLKEEVDYIKERGKLEHIDTVSFRTNEWLLDFMFTVWVNGKPVLFEPAYENEYFCAFLSGLSLRESCYKCRYKCIERVGDILIGDFIGLGKDIPFDGNPAQKSLVLIMNEKGEQYFTKANDRVNIVSRTLEEALKEGRSLREVYPRHPQRDLFLKAYQENGFVDAVNIILGGEINSRKKKSLKIERKRKLKLWLKYNLRIRIEGKRISYER